MFSDATDSALFEREGAVGTIILNRPKALNALNDDMLTKILPKVVEWNASPDVQTIVMKGAGGKAFCAGGDVVSVRNKGMEGQAPKDVASFFKDEYHLNHLLATATTPQVSILNGFTMGGGVGLSVHGKYRVATTNTMFAMPETTIGFFPDVGGSHFLPQLQGSFGMYLALTGARLKGKDVMKAGIATHFVSSENMEALEAGLKGIQSSSDVQGVLDSACEGGADDASFTPHLDLINSCFARGSVEEVLEALESEGSEWALKHAATLRRVSPFALKVTHEMLTKSATHSLDIKECLRMEYRAAMRVMEDGEFYEGVRALLIDKDQSPAWKHASLPEVPAARVARCFEPLDPATEGPELDFD